MQIHRGVIRSNRYQNLVNRLARLEDHHTNKSLFETIKQLMFFAAALGWINNNRKAIDNLDEKETIGTREWLGEENLAFIAMLAIVEKENIEILKTENQNEMIQIFEEYSNGGFEILNNRFENSPHNDDSAELLFEIYDEYLKEVSQRITLDINEISDLSQ